MEIAMKRKKLVSTCPVCGKKANISRKLVKARDGRIYYYVRFYHNSKNIHFSPTDPSYSSFQIAENKTKNLYSALTDFIARTMGPKGMTYTSLKKEIEKSYNGFVYNEEFNRSIKKATNDGLIERRVEKNKPLYSKISEVELEERLKFDQFAINFDFSGKELIVTNFILLTNNGKIPIRKIPHFVPTGPLDFLDSLNLKVHDETDEIPLQNLSIVFSTALETVFSVTLNKDLSKDGKNFIFMSYSIPAASHSTNFLIQVATSTLRIALITERGYDARMIRTLVNGAKETEMSFPRHYFYGGNRICLQVELDDLQKGENIYIELKEKQSSNKNQNLQRNTEK